MSELLGLKLGDSLDPEKLLKLSKKNKPVMMFIKLRGSASREETERISNRWAHGLLNGHIPVQSFVVSDDKVLFVVQEGSRAWDAKEYLVEQEDCIEVQLEQISYPCKQPREEEKHVEL